MKKLLLLLTAAASFFPISSRAQNPGEIVTAAVVQVPSDLFNCGRGKQPCNLRVRTYSELDPTDFFGAANPVDGYPRYSKLGQYRSDGQLTGNYPSASGFLDLNWFAVWDGVIRPDSFDHVGFYGGQSQVVSFGEVGNSNSTTCLPVVAQTACFFALAFNGGNDLQEFGPGGAEGRLGGLSPIPRPQPVFSDPSRVDFAWEEANAATVNDGAPFPILGYKLFFAARDLTDRVGPTETELEQAEVQGTLIDATPGTFIPRTTTSFSLAANDPVLASFDAATQSLVAVIKIVYAHEVLSTHFSANAFPARFVDPGQQVIDFHARLNRNRVTLTWRMSSLAGIRGFNILRSGQAEGAYHPIDRVDIPVNGVQGTFVAVDRLRRSAPVRDTREMLFYRLEITSLDGSRSFLAPLGVDLNQARRGDGSR
ncbi:MAG: hypothetical protein ACE5HD_02955 [Acidobacteriota bacterium]